MKKLFKLLTPLATMLVVLTACSGEKTKTFVNEETKLEYTIYYKGDVVDKTTTVTTTDFSSDDHKSELEFIKKAVDEKNSGIDGFTYTVEEKDNKIQVTWVFDYTKMNFDKDKEKLGFTTSSLDEERKLSHVEKELKQNGFKEKK